MVNKLVSSIAVSSILLQYTVVALYHIHLKLVSKWVIMKINLLKLSNTNLTMLSTVMTYFDKSLTLGKDFLQVSY